MISPSPTPPTTTPTPPAPYVPETPPPVAEKKAVALTPAKRRAGETPLARFVKAVLRPIFKVIYYGIRWIRTHKVVSILAALFILVSIFTTSYFATGRVPLVTYNEVEQSIQGNPQMSPDVQAWLLALKEGDIETMLTVQKAMSQTTRPPDSALYVLQFSETRGQTKWTSANVSSLRQAPDGMIDTYVEISMNIPTSSGGAQPIITLWHFTTTQKDGRIYLLDYVSARLAR